MEKVPKLKLQVLKVRNIMLILSKLVNEINSLSKFIEYLSFLRSTFGTNPLQYIVYAVQSKSSRQINHRDMGAFQAECLVAFLTIEM